jgi:hypothetical protein
VKLYFLFAELRADPKPETTGNLATVALLPRVESVIEPAIAESREVLRDRNDVPTNRRNFIDGEATARIEPLEAIFLHEGAELTARSCHSRGRRTTTARVSRAPVLDIFIHDVIRDVRRTRDGPGNAVATVHLALGDVVLDEGVSHFSLLDHILILPYSLREYTGECETLFLIC